MPPWIHLVLDIDGTLVGADGQARPHLAAFLRDCFDACASVSIWTAASEDWLNSVLANVLMPIMRNTDSFKYTWHGDRCSRLTPRNTIRYIQRHGEMPDSLRTIKQLKKMWRRDALMTRMNTLIIDDTPITYSSNYGNALPIDTYVSGTFDSMLLCMAERVHSFDAPDVRKVRTPDVGIGAIRRDVLVSYYDASNGCGWLSIKILAVLIMYLLIYMCFVL